MTPLERRKISPAEFAQLIAGGKVFEQAGDQPTAVLHADGELFIKVWQRKRGLSSDKVSAYGLRFCRNCARLLERQIEAPRVRAFYTVQPGGQHVALYPYLQGWTLRQLAAAGQLPVSDLARFYVELHTKGIYFRSLHIGNILRLSNGRFALLDVTDVKFYQRPLSLERRARNLNDTWTRPRLRHLLPPPTLEALVAAYREAAGFAAGEDLRFNERMRQGLGL